MKKTHGRRKKTHHRTKKNYGKIRVTTETNVTRAEDRCEI